MHAPERNAADGALPAVEVPEGAEPQTICLRRGASLASGGGRLWLVCAPEPYAFIPFGGGVRRCVGAAFASLEMKEVLRAVARRFELRPATGGGERMRRRSITMTPSLGGYVVPHSPRHADVLPPQPADRQLPDLQPGAAG